jgi:hypothetical protein
MYGVTVTNVNGCEAIDSLEVTVNNPNPVTITGFTSMCAYTVDTLRATTGFDTYVWSTSDTTNKIVIDANTLGQGSYTYMVTATDPNGCVSDASTSFNVYQSVFIDLGTDTTVKWIDGVQETYIVDAGSGYASYLWKDNSTSQKFTVTLKNMGVISVTVTDANGCEGTDDVFVDFLLGVTGISNIEVGTITMYPNPAHEVLNVELSNFVSTDNIAIKIINITGQMVIEKKYDVNGNTIKKAIDITSLPTGTYFIEFMVGSQIETKSFIVR